MWDLLSQAQDAGTLGRPLVTDVDPAALPMLQDKARGLEDLPVEVQAAGWTALSLLRGAEPRRREATGVPASAGQPSGPSGRPPRTCTCRWWTVWPPSGPVLVSSR